VNMAWTAYIYDEKCWSTDFSYSLYIACRAYIYIWWKMLFHRLPLQSLHGFYRLYVLNLEGRNIG
jgi:hypothetical protein